MLQISKNQMKRRIKKHLLENNTSITVEQVISRFYRKMTVDEAEDLLEEMANTDRMIVKEQLSDGSYVYFYRYKPKKAYYY